MRITTWNINSVRLRAPLAIQVLKILKPDVLCLQETKCPNELFPYEVFQADGIVVLVRYLFPAQMLLQ